VRTICLLAKQKPVPPHKSRPSTAPGRSEHVSARRKETGKEQIELDCPLSHAKDFSPHPTILSKKRGYRQAQDCQNLLSWPALAPLTPVA